MTSRLETALKALTADQIEELTKVAEAMAIAPARGNEYKMQFKWVGVLAHLPEETSLESQAAALREWEELIDRPRKG